MTDEEIKEVLRRAATVVEVADLPSELRTAAFTKAVDLLVLGTDEGVGKGGGHHGEVSDAIERVANRLQVDKDLVDETLDIDDVEVRLVMADSFHNEKQKGAKQIAVLLAAARQAAGLEDWTELKTIRQWVDHYGRYDGNFARSIAQLGEYFSFSGSGQAMQVRVRRAGFEEAGNIIRAVHGAG